MLRWNAGLHLLLQALFYTFQVPKRRLHNADDTQKLQLICIHGPCFTGPCFTAIIAFLMILRSGTIAGGRGPPPFREGRGRGDFGRGVDFGRGRGDFGRGDFMPRGRGDLGSRGRGFMEDDGPFNGRGRGFGDLMVSIALALELHSLHYTPNLGSRLAKRCNSASPGKAKPLQELMIKSLTSLGGGGFALQMPFFREEGKACQEVGVASEVEVTLHGEGVTLGVLEGGRGGRGGVGEAATMRDLHLQRWIQHCWRGGEQATQPC